MRQKNEYALSTGELGTPTRTVDYGYGNADWQDQLTSYNGSTITYDAIGNPTIWYNGTQMTWQKGRQLTGINSSVSGTTMYTYDDSGLRTSKTMNGVRTEYYRSGSRLIGQKQGSSVMQLLYDANGLYGFLYNGTPHYYVYNGQGDVVRLISASGATEAMYTYDAWGKILSVTDGSGNTISDASHIANVNPIRYRGYYYDVETGFYYLQSRYYDPEVGRFINADGLVSTGQGVLGFNMYAYCGNNPVTSLDYTGAFPIRNKMVMMTDGGKIPLIMKRIFEFTQYAIDHNIKLYNSADSAAEAWANENRELSAERERMAYIYECYGSYYLSDTYTGMKGFAFVQDNVIFPTLKLQFFQISYGSVYGMIHSHPDPGIGYHNDFPSANDNITGGDRIAFELFGYEEMYIVPYKRCNNTPAIIKYTDPQTWCSL